MDQKFCGITIDTMDPIAAKYNETVGNLSGAAIKPKMIPKMPMINIQGPSAYCFLNFVLAFRAMDDTSQTEKRRFSSIKSKFRAAGFGYPRNGFALLKLYLLIEKSLRLSAFELRR